MKQQRLHGLYAITDNHLASGNSLPRQVALAVAGGARVIQYRDKGEGHRRRHREASELMQLCRENDVPLIINDDLELAAEVGADGVHLGRDDPAIAQARQRLGQDALIGVSCYNRFELAIAAQHAGADYIAFGRFFPSASKPDAVQADVELLRRARRVQLPIPVVAIGGITPENGGQLIAAGASMLAVIQGVFGQPDIRSACERFQRIFEHY